LHPHMSKIPLKTRKSIKAALEGAIADTKKASEAFGKELTFIDNTAELFEKLQAANKGEDFLFELGSKLKPYVAQFAKVMIEFCKNSDNKEQLEAELTTGKFGVRLQAAEKSTDDYWCLEDGVLWMETKEHWFGFYIDNYDVDRLCQRLGRGDSMHLNTRKNLKAAQPKIDDAMKAASKSFGKELTWIDNYQTLYDKLKASGKPEDALWKIGDQIALYPQQLAKVFATFCTDADNKEALEEVLTSGKAGVRFQDPTKSNDEYWCIEDGTIWMETKEHWWGFYLDSYDADKIEKKL